MVPVRKSCRLNGVSEWGWLSFGVWGKMEKGERTSVHTSVVTARQEGFGMGRSCQGFEEGPVLSVLVLSPYPSWCCSSNSPFF